MMGKRCTARTLVTLISGAMLLAMLVATMAESKSPSGTPNASTKLGIDLIKGLSAKTGNVFISPLSIHACLQLAYAGAAGTTASEMASVLGLSGMAPEAAADDYGRFADKLHEPSRSCAFEGPGKSLILEIANSLWGNKNVKFRQKYIDLLKNSYRAECTTLDFSSSASVSKVNSWVDKKTRGKINGILSRLDPEGMMVLVNAAYFKARWADEFDKANTRQELFSSGDGTSLKVPMMHAKRQMSYLETKDFQAVMLPYVDHRFSMYVFLPSKSRGLAGFMGMLTMDNWVAWRKQLALRPGELGLPRFRLGYESSLASLLASLGMKSAFSAKADFSGMAVPPPAPFISDVVHKTYVDVDETGTEAAAVTAIPLAGCGLPPPQPPFKMIVDRPFFFALVHESSGAMLFAGTMSRPEQAK